MSAFYVFILVWLSIYKLSGIGTEGPMGYF